MRDRDEPLVERRRSIERDALRGLVEHSEQDDVAARVALPPKACREPTYSQTPEQHAHGSRIRVELRQFAVVLANDPKLERLLESDVVTVRFAREKLFRRGELGRAQVLDEAPCARVLVTHDGIDVDP